MPRIAREIAFGELRRESSGFDHGARRNMIGVGVFWMRSEKHMWLEHPDRASNDGSRGKIVDNFSVGEWQLQTIRTQDLCRRRRFLRTDFW